MIQPASSQHPTPSPRSLQASTEPFCAFPARPGCAAEACGGSAAAHSTFRRRRSDAAALGETLRVRATLRLLAERWALATRWPGISLLGTLSWRSNHDVSTAEGGPRDGVTSVLDDDERFTAPCSATAPPSASGRAASRSCHRSVESTARAARALADTISEYHLEDE